MLAPQIAVARALPLADMRHLYDRYEDQAAEQARASQVLQRMDAERQRWPHSLEDAQQRPPFLPAHSERELGKAMVNPLKVLTTGVERGSTQYRGHASTKVPTFDSQDPNLVKALLDATEGRGHHAQGVVSVELGTDELRGNYLGPMHSREGLAVVQLDMRGTQVTRDLQGQSTTHDALVRAWQVKAAPTVLFLGPGGREVADRLVGGSPDFYSAYLDGRLERARQAVRKS